MQTTKAPQQQCSIRCKHQKAISTYKVFKGILPSYCLKGGQPLIVAWLLRNAYLHSLRKFLAQFSALIAIMHCFPCRKFELHQACFSMHFTQNQLGQSAPIIAHLCYMFYSRQEIPELNQLHTYKHNGQDECLCLIVRQYLWKLLTKGWTRWRAAYGTSSAASFTQ